MDWQGNQTTPSHEVATLVVKTRFVVGVRREQVTSDHGTGHSSYDDQLAAAAYKLARHAQPAEMAGDLGTVIEMLHWRIKSAVEMRPNSMSRRISLMLTSTSSRNQNACNT